MASPLLSGGGQRGDGLVGIALRRELRGFERMRHIADAPERDRARDRTSVLRRARGEEMIRDPVTLSEAQTHVPGGHRAG